VAAQYVVRNQSALSNIQNRDREGVPHGPVGPPKYLKNGAVAAVAVLAGVRRFSQTDSPFGQSLLSFNRSLLSRSCDCHSTCINSCSCGCKTSPEIGGVCSASSFNRVIRLRDSFCPGTAFS